MPQKLYSEAEEVTETDKSIKHNRVEKPNCLIGHVKCGPDLNSGLL